MRIPALLATSLAALLLLCSCAPSTTPSAHATSTPSPTVSTPAYLATDQTASDILPSGVAATVGVDDDSTRYEGDWDGRQVFLGVRNDASVCLVTGIPEVAGSWVAQCGSGNEVITWKTEDGGIVKYVPIGTPATPQGWTRLSDFVFAM
ncbi:hypothetical protein BH10ACT6_BH10ACT6_06760 [soil metagenome]